MKTPFISVVIASYNCERYIVEALESVLAQTFHDFEVIVVDSSTDGTRTKLLPYRDKITLLYQTPQGVSAARNYGLGHAKGEWIAFQDADDVWLPEKLFIQIEAIKRFPNAAIVFSEATTFDETGIVQPSTTNQVLEDWCEEHRNRQEGESYCGNLYQSLLVRNIIPTCSVLVQRNALADAGGFDESFETCEDLDLWLRIAKKSDFVYVDQALCKYRIRSDGLSGGIDIRGLRWGIDGIKVREKHLRNQWIPSGCLPLVYEVLARKCWEVGYGFFSRNRFEEARAVLSRNFRYQPSHLLSWFYWLVSWLPLPLVMVLRRFKSSLGC